MDYVKLTLYIHIYAMFKRKNENIMSGEFKTVKIIN